MAIGLGREIPTAIYSAIDDFALGLMRGSDDAFGVPYAAMRWALHPGGPMIIQAICDRLGLGADDAGVRDAWSVLRRYGNMSSATVSTLRTHPLQHTSAGRSRCCVCAVRVRQLIFVLDEMRKESMSGAWVPALAFGPGLNVEGALFRACDGERQKGSVARASAQKDGGEGKEERKTEDVERKQHVSFSQDVRNNTGLL